MVDLIAIGVGAVIVILVFIGSELSDISRKLSEINGTLVDIRDADTEEDQTTMRDSYLADVGDFGKYALLIDHTLLRA
jgi:hypothetical protein